VTAVPDEVLVAPNILEYPYTRTTGPILGRFFTSLRDKRIEGIRLADGSVVVPPTEHDRAGNAVDPDAFVEVGPGGVISTWAWVNEPREKHPLDRPFAWALIRLDGATTAMLHAVAADDESAIVTGTRVMPKWREEREGHIKDIEYFVLAGEG
jgi:uncharacterized OB-fold protein